MDVGKDSLDICHPDGTKEHIKNTRRFRTKLIKKAKDLGTIDSIKATGPHEEHLADECRVAGVVKGKAWSAPKGIAAKPSMIPSRRRHDFAASVKPLSQSCQIKPPCCLLPALVRKFSIGMLNCSFSAVAVSANATSVSRFATLFIVCGGHSVLLSGKRTRWLRYETAF